jgi:tetratricopeptide (TPR) repeat protein
VPAAAARRTTPAALGRKLRGDLDNVLLMALRKEPERRYGTAAELVDDLERYRRRRPVRARADALGYRVGKFVERHRAALATALAAAVILGAALGLITAQRLAAERQAARARQMEHMLGQLFASASPGSEPPTVRRMLDEGVRLAREELHGQPESQARLLTLLGRTYNSLGLYDQSIAVLQEALTLHGAIPEQEDEATSETLSWLAQGMHYTSRFPEALALSRRLYELRRRQFGPDHGRTVDARLLVADILHSLGRLPEAEVEARGALAYLRRAGGNANVLALGLANLGNVLRDRGELDEAEQVFRESVALSRRLHGPLDQQALHSEIYLARTLIARGEPAAAESMLRADLSGLQRIHGGDHPATGEALRELGHALIALRRYPEAAACLERALGVFRRFLDERHTMLARVRVHQAELELERGEAAKAVAIARDALDRFARLGLTEHPAALDTRRILGRALLALDDRAAAVSVLEGCLALEERLFVAADARTEQTRAALALARSPVAASAFRRIPRHGPPQLRSQRDFGRVHRPHPGNRGRRAARLLDAAHGSERGDALRAQHLRADGGGLARGGTRRNGAARDARVGTEARGEAEVRRVAHAERVSMAEHDQGGG